MDLTVLGKTTRRFVIDNSPQILTAVGVVGTVSTAVLTGKAAFKAGRIIHEMENNPYAEEAHDPREKVEATWKLFIPPVGTGLITITAIVGANHISAGRAAALATAFTLSERSFEEYRKKVIEKLGTKKEEEVRAEIATERIHRHEDESNLIVVSGTDVLCYDMFSDRYFTSNMEALKHAQNALNHTLLSDGFACLADFYDLIGLPTTAYSEEVGWTSDELLEVKFSTVLSKDMRPCLAIDYTAKPNRHRSRFLP